MTTTMAAFSIICAPILYLISAAFLATTEASSCFAQQCLVTENLESDLDNYIVNESQISLSRIFCNIGPVGACVPGTSSGLVVAGPGKSNPDYFYTWTRDSALTFKYLVDKFIDEYDRYLQEQIENYIDAQAKLQTVANPSGNLHDGSGLGEPKFNTDGSPFPGSWGRPQRDGPALRAITLITYSKWLITAGLNQIANDNVWPIIRNDLSYIAQYWNQTGFDLWEEVEGSSFFTILSQYRALVEGCDLASLLGISFLLCNTQPPQLACFLQKFWDPSRGYILANINESSGRSAKDASTIIASIHQFDPTAGCDSLTFQPCSDLALANHKVVTDSFRSIYPINFGISQGKAVSVGRYPEDIYYKGNPWYLTTLAAAEQLYDALYVWEKFKFINITNISLHFFQDFSPNIQIGIYQDTTLEYQNLLNSISSYADEFVKVVQRYAQFNGSLSEQFDKVTGNPSSAYDLTWSYVAFLTAVSRRSRIVSFSWTKLSIRYPPSVCDAKPEKGNYEPAPQPTWPIDQVPPNYTPSPSSNPTKTLAPCTPVPIVLVSFNKLITTSYGDTIKILGSESDLGNWKLENATALSASNYSPSFPLWRATIPITSGITIQYKYLNFKADGTIEWEDSSDHTLNVPRSCETVMSVTDT
ncbi:putative glycoside hydrolase family 15 protein [Erysiphe necator]|uniref:Glucoamylase n=1 Tax=Uncinula necator TaxID=52586 RepID=A0A0B1NZL7_UNCNE|nr:putative glycoside hydrolase family 15 protein [Erysiphe necator]